MTTTTTYNTTAANYVQVSTGSANVTVQGVGDVPFEMIVAQALPSATTGGLVIDANSGFVASLTNLAGTDNVYVRASASVGGAVRVLAS